MTQRTLAHAQNVCPMDTRGVIDKILAFVEVFNGKPFYLYQRLFARRLVESILENDGAILTGLWSRQSGKTECIAATIIGCALILPALSKVFPDDQRLKPFKDGFWAGIYAPKQEQSDISFTRMRNRVNSEEGQAIMADPELGPIKLVTNRGDTLMFSNGSIVMSRTASPETELEGKTWHVVIVEEAQNVQRSKVEKEIRPMLATTNGSMVCIGTAGESRGGFHVSIQDNVAELEKGGKRNHFEFPYDIVIAERRRMAQETGDDSHLRYEKFVEKEKVRYGENSNEFKMNYKCLWMESRVIAVRVEVLDAAACADLEAGPVMYGPFPNNRYMGFQVAGLDIGKVHDSTVLTSMAIDLNTSYLNHFYSKDADLDKQKYYRKYIFDWLELEGSFEGSAGQYQLLVNRLLMMNIQILVIDATAMGDPVFERINAMVGEDIKCVPFKFGGVSKANLYKYYMQELHAGRVLYPAGAGTRGTREYEKFRQEHLDLDKEQKGGYVAYQAPEGLHDDYPDSAALACWAEFIADSVLMPDIEVSSSAPSGGASDNPARRGQGNGSFFGAQQRGGEDRVFGRRRHR